MSAQRGLLTAVICTILFSSILFWTCCLCGFLPEKEPAELDVAGAYSPFQNDACLRGLCAIFR